ncbi:hypothetical protein CI41S_30050 [Bradyrhizobium ivorense]|nr:hypothetical protein CI41S_30050 [Bradyrhizobium ivorense]
MEEENAKLKSRCLMRRRFASSFKKCRTRRQACCGRACAGGHELVGTADLLDRGRRSNDDPLSAQPLSGHGSARPAARSRQRANVSATVRYSSCRNERPSRRASPDLSTLPGGRAHRPQAAASLQGRGDRTPILVEAKPNSRWSLDFVHDQFVRQRPAPPHPQHRRQRHQGMPGRHSGHLDLGAARWRETHGNRRATRQARNDRVRPWQRVYLQCHARPQQGCRHRLATPSRRKIRCRMVSSRVSCIDGPADAREFVSTFDNGRMRSCIRRVVRTMPWPLVLMEIADRGLINGVALVAIKALQACSIPSSAAFPSCCHALTP